MTGYFCPVEGCEKHEDEWDDDQPPFDSVGGVRGHVNAKPDENHQQARDRGAWVETLEAGEAGDGEGDESSDDQGESRDEQADDQQNEGNEDPLEEDDQMVSPEEYQEQQDSSSETEGREGDESRDEQADDQGEGTPLPSVDSALPDVPPMTGFVIVAGIFAAIIIWRVYRARSSDEPDVETTIEDESERQTEQQGMTMIEQ
ncbi:structural protein VP3 [Saline Natrinema sp. J7-1 virus 1]|uniref:Structural protein VP3 n=1 Tax=Saline Natrinema sp. J7-1 virus 1 TaxID=2847285 RepID=A0AAE9VL03_9VIRU|nr:structural protein VP3 [Saline Natrinema sp. J7-1 virus 1]WBE14022.1 structural protein VP3 [Saline Natrinema sp. J7-1 virus 1]